MTEKYEDEVTVLFGDLKSAQNEAFQEGIQFALNRARKLAHLGDFGFSELAMKLRDATLYEVPERAAVEHKCSTPTVGDLIKQLAKFEPTEPVISQFFVRGDFTDGHGVDEKPFLTPEQFCKLYNMVERDRMWTESFEAFMGYARDIKDGK
jgi:hypothetical protein